jgi:hypothetical protein
MARLTSWLQGLDADSLVAPRAAALAARRAAPPAAPPAEAAEFCADGYRAAAEPAPAPAPAPAARFEGGRFQAWGPE